VRAQDVILAARQKRPTFVSLLNGRDDADIVGEE